MHADALERARDFARRHGLNLEKELGCGYEGVVFSTQHSTAVKALRYETHYLKERDVYLRLTEHGISLLNGFHIPRLVRYDDQLWIVEMEIVSPPFVLDFAGAYLDEKPGYTRRELHQWELEKREQFGRRWPRVRSVLSAFRRYGIHLADVKPGNVVFRDKPIDDAGQTA